MMQRLQSLLAHPAAIFAARVALAAAYVAIVLASIVPKDYRPASGIVPGAMEHLAAYFVLGLLGAAILRGQTSWWVLALANAGLAAALERAQVFVPGRIAHVIDFGASALGSLAGILALRALYRAP